MKLQDVTEALRAVKDADTNHKGGHTQQWRTAAGGTAFQQQQQQQQKQLSIHDAHFSCMQQLLCTVSMSCFVCNSLPVHQQPAALQI
jgi:hypothetical protein